MDVQRVRGRAQPQEALEDVQHVRTIGREVQGPLAVVRQRRVDVEAQPLQPTDAPQLLLLQRVHEVAQMLVVRLRRRGRDRRCFRERPQFQGLRLRLLGARLLVDGVPITLVAARLVPELVRAQLLRRRGPGVALPLVRVVVVLLGGLVCVHLFAAA